jgi:hypothetical protein
MEQTVFNWAVGISGFLGGWVLKVIWEAIKDLKGEVRDVDRHLNENFVRRADFKDAVTDIKADMKEGFEKVDRTLGLLFKKLDNKEDK